MSTTCKYCNEAEDKQNRPGLLCYGCMNFVHITCLRRSGTPGDLACDVFFEFTCESCSPDKCESFVRYKFPWVNVIYLTLNHLCTQSYGISHHGYFHYKTHICSFIDRYWQTLFGSSNKQKKNWIGTIAGVLSVHNKLFFKSGSTVLGETGWWRLLHNFSPAVAAHIIQEMARDKPKNRPRNQLAMDRNHFVAKICEMGYKDLINPDTDEALEIEQVPCKKKRVDSVDSVVSGASYFDHVDSDSGRYETDEHSFADSLLVPTGRYTSYDLDNRGSFEFPPASRLMQKKNSKVKQRAAPRSSPAGVGDVGEADGPVSDTSSVHSLNPSTALYYDSDSRSGSDDRRPAPDDLERRPDDLERRPDDLERLPDDLERRPDDLERRPDELDRRLGADRSRNTQPVRRESLFSTHLNSEDMPWEDDFEKEADKRPKQKLVELTQYEEIHLLKQVEVLISRVKDPSKKAYLHRLKAKLALRRLKRHKHLPLFDLDKTVKILGGYVTEDPGEVVNVERVLDRFQRSYLLDSLCGTISRGLSGTVLLPRPAPAALRSVYSGAALRPYIRREGGSEPPWLALTDELLTYTHRDIKDYRLPARATIDYSYVRPEHIAAINSLVAQFFWPGIDLTEALQYPEFSCVASYKRLAVGCAFLVPDSGRNEAYISFVLTRPEWRRAGIATFMLYHLLQTCTGKDVTLHCSPTNPAIFLYQKFGFKVEELVQDFYEKYFDIEYKGCRHALFLRLVR